MRISEFESINLRISEYVIRMWEYQNVRITDVRITEYENIRMWGTISECEIQYQNLRSEYMNIRLSECKNIRM